MIDNLSLALSHGLLVLAIWQLLRRPELDDERGDKGFRKPRARFGNGPRA